VSTTPQPHPVRELLLIVWRGVRTAIHTVLRAHGVGAPHTRRRRARLCVPRRVRGGRTARHARPCRGGRQAVRTLTTPSAESLRLPTGRVRRASPPHRPREDARRCANPPPPLTAKVRQSVATLQAARRWARSSYRHSITQSCAPPWLCFRGPCFPNRKWSRLLGWLLRGSESAGAVAGASRSWERGSPR
jgi:hypothetical protein